MIRHPLAVVCALIAVEACVLFVSTRQSLKKYFSFLPPVFWIYFLPMLLASIGLLDSHSPVYALIAAYVLPASLVLLLLSSDIRGIFRLGGKALAMMAAGTCGIMLGTVLVVSLLKGKVAPQSWSGFGALSASWSGGSANMIAVKEALGTPDAVFAPMVIVDTIVPYVWMGLLIILASRQKAFDAWNGSDISILGTLSGRITVQEEDGAGDKSGRLSLSLVALVAAAGSFLSRWVASLIPEIPEVLSRYAWMIICVSCLGIALSFTRVRELGRRGATEWGYYLLYFVLTSIGAKASIRDLGGAFLLILAGFMIVMVHGLVLLSVARLIRAPLFLAAAASQANIGGVASAPVVAAVYQPGLASVGLLLAVCGNIVGTYVGILTGRICYLVR